MTVLFLTSEHHVDDSPGRTLTGCDLQTQQVCDLPTTQQESASGENFWFMIDYFHWSFSFIGPEPSHAATKEKTKVAPLFTGKLHTFVNKSYNKQSNTTQCWSSKVVLQQWFYTIIYVSRMSRYTSVRMQWR